MIVVGYTADRFGTAALEHGIAEAKLRDTKLLVINSTRGDSYVDAAFAQTGEVHDVEGGWPSAGSSSSSTSPSGWTPPMSCWRRWTARTPSCW